MMIGAWSAASMFSAVLSIIYGYTSNARLTEPAVYRNPYEKKYKEGDDKLPTAAEFRDPVSSSVGQGESRLLLLIHVARNAVSQELVRTPQPICQGRKQFQRHARIVFHEPQEILAR